MTLNERLRAARLAVGVENASAFARSIGVTPNTVYRYESGEIRPSIEHLAAWARECRTTTDALLGLEPHTEIVTRDETARECGS